LANEGISMPANIMELKNYVHSLHIDKQQNA
jgi:hypothetical protein